ncbi:phasin family protein [Dokdonella sp.]|uniref:phasin family protein n=1 Tax=Dokdonella sp. TaxID=2291710 RepID=UPI003C46C051
MSKQIKVNKTSKTKVAPNADNAQRIWLASLGAFSIAQKQGSELFETMISEGKSFQVRSEKLARKVSADVRKGFDSRLKPVKARVLATRKSAEAKFEKGLGQALSYAGIPSKADVDALINRVDRLSRQLRAAK